MIIEWSILYGAIHTSELDRSEIDLSPKRSECERSNANWDRSKCERRLPRLIFTLLVPRCTSLVLRLYVACTSLVRRCTSLVPRLYLACTSLVPRLFVWRHKQLANKIVALSCSNQYLLYHKIIFLQIKYNMLFYYYLFYLTFS